MKLNRITLENIRSHKETTLDLERIVTIRAANHSGKSSLVNGLEMALARRSDVTEGAKERAQTDLIRFGQEKSAIELMLDVDGIPVELRASLTKRSGLNVTLRNPNDKEWNPVDFAKELADDKDILSCLCNNGYFIGLKPADQKNLLASIILPTRYEWPENIKSDLHQARITLNWTLPPFDIIEAGYKAAFSARTEVNRSIKDWRAPGPVAEYSGPPVDAIRAKLSERQTERTGLAVQQEKMLGAIREAEQAKANHERRAQEAQTKIETEKRERVKIAENGLGKAALKNLEKEAAGLAKAEALDEAILKRSPEINLLLKQLEKLETLAAFSECPECRQTITDEVFASIVDPLKAKMNDLNDAQDADFRARKELGDPAGAQKKLDANKTVDEDLARIDRRIKDLERTVANATAEAEKIKPEELPKPDSLTEQIADIDARILKGTNALADAARADALKVDAAKANQRKKELDEELARLERLVIYFGPKGVKAELIKEHIGGFQSGINAVLEAWGYSCALELEPYGFVVSRLGSPYSAQLHMLSRSEQMRFSNAFTVALATVSGWNFAVLDDSETIVGEDYATFYKLVYQSSLEQAIILAAKLEGATPPFPGTTFVKFTETIEAGISTTSATVLASTPR